MHDAKWIGEIPAHWGVTRGKWLFVKQERPVRKDDEIVTCFRDGQVTLRLNRKTEGFTNALKEHGYQGIRKGDLVIHAMDAFAGAIGVSDSDGKSTPVYSACTPRKENEVYPYYYAYYLRSLAKNGVIVSLAKGIRERSTDFRFNDFGELLLVKPPIAEQISIANFLDKKTALIDKAIAFKEKQIELLKERRQILIHRAVTRGLNPNVKLKDSGVEWIGEVPEHWGVKALKYIAYLKSGETISSDSFIDDQNGYPVYGGNGFRGYTNTFTNDGFYCLIGRQGALCGNVNYASGKFFASEHAIVVYPLKLENSHWLGEVIKVADFNKYSQSAAQPGISVSVIKNILFPYPDLSEQDAISNYIKKIEESFTKYSDLKEEEIKKLNEYKSSIINNTVTGKIKVI